jgi:hypothetical protein
MNINSLGYLLPNEITKTIMKNKTSIVQKLEAQTVKLQHLQREIELGRVTGPNAIVYIEGIKSDIRAVAERLDLEPND